MKERYTVGGQGQVALLGVYSHQEEEDAFQATEDTAYASRPFPLFASSSSSRVEASLAAILDHFQHMRADFGCRLDHLSDDWSYRSLIVSSQWLRLFSRA